MRVSLNLRAVQSLKPSELMWRFALGGAITAGAAWIARTYGPALGGLFLAFPSILPLTLTLLARHQEERKSRLGLHGVIRGRQAAALDAFGAVMGSAGLTGFAIIVRLAATRIGVPWALIIATTVWLLVAGALWVVRKRRSARGF